MSNTESTANIREVYKLTGDLRTDMNSGFERIERQISDMSVKFALQADVEALKTRVGRLEQWRWYLIGVFAVLLALATYFSNEIKAVIFRQ